MRATLRVTARVGAVVTVVAALVMSGGVSAHAGISSDVSADIHVKIPAGRFALGDSVMLGAKYRLKALGFQTVDAKQSRQAYTGPAELRRRGGSLPQNVVVHLGTNGTFPLSTCEAMVRAVGPERRLFLVTVHVARSWTKSNNKVIRQCASKYPAGRVTVIDWDWAASRHPSWLYPDRTHLKPAGATGYARLIAAAINRTAGPITRSARD